MIRIRCVVERITYQSPETGYSVLKCALKGYDDLITVVGNLLDATAGAVLLIDGDWKIDKSMAGSSLPRNGKKPCRQRYTGLKNIWAQA